MVSLEEAKKIVLEKHPEEWFYQIAEYKDCYQFWLLPKNEKWYPTTFVWDTPIMEKETGRLNDTEIVFEKIEDKDCKLYDYRHSND